MLIRREPVFSFGDPHGLHEIKGLASILCTVVSSIELHSDGFLAAPNETMQSFIIVNARQLAQNSREQPCVRTNRALLSARMQLFSGHPLG